MKPNTKMLFIVLVTFAFTSCATIISGNHYPFSVRTEPAGANVIIKNKKGTELYNGTTPTNLILKSGAGYFRSESYTVEISLNGYEPKSIKIECRLNGWYFANIFIGGALGMLVIDPLTGAMYKLDTKDVFETLKIKSTSFNNKESSLIIIEKDKLPADCAGHLLSIQ